MRGASQAFFHTLRKIRAKNFTIRRVPASLPKKCVSAYTDNVKRLLFTGGGSAGHVVPNLAVMQELCGTYDVAYMGTDGIERGLAGAFSCPYYTVNCPKLVRAATPRNLTVPFRLAAARRKALDILRRETFDLVFSKGGYVSYPAVWAAHRLKVPVLTHESVRSPGLCTRMIAGKCRYVLTSFPETAGRFRNGRCVGSPMRRELFRGDRLAARAKYGFSGRKPVLLVLGGGSGSRALNEAVRSNLAALLLRFDILHLCGKGNRSERTARGYVQLEYERDMGAAYACCDLALSRAGSNAVFELIALKKPALLVPLAHASRGDQAQNAAYFARKDLCAVLDEGHLDTLPSALLCLYGNAKIRAALERDHTVSGTQAIADVIRSVIG